MVLVLREPNSRASGSILLPTGRSNNSCTYNNSSPHFRVPCMADFLMEFRRDHCMDVPCPLHRENMITGMDLDMSMAMGMAIVMPTDIDQERADL